LPHEHVISFWDGSLLDSTLHPDWGRVEELAVRKLTAAKQMGINSIVDMSTFEMGRDVELLKRVSERSEVHIVCCTGLFAEEYGVPYYFRQMPPQQLTRLYVTEIEKGIGFSGARAGVIKIATGGREVTELEERIIGAAALAQRETGVPILTHTGRGGGGVRQIELLLQAGVPPEKVVIGHSDVSADLKYHLKLLKYGVYVGFDRIGLLAFISDEIRAHCIKALVDLGHAARLTMSLDAYATWIGHEAPPLAELERDYTYFMTSFVPLLRRVGVGDDTVREIMVENPRRLFELDAVT
jgi:phosphotriesterase-related protein